MANLIDEVAMLCAKRATPEALTQAFSTLLRKRVSHYHWVGVYMVEGGELVLKGWDGEQATEHVRIPIGEGICGLAAREDRTVVVDDVSKDPRYLQCFLKTKSEMVVPIRHGKTVIGEIDIDCEKLAPWNDADKAFLEWCADRLGVALGAERKTIRKSATRAVRRD
jgi:GAF domain-containing protein